MVVDGQIQHLHRHPMEQRQHLARVELGRGTQGVAITRARRHQPQGTAPGRRGGYGRGTMRKSDMQSPRRRDEGNVCKNKGYLEE